ncbi:peroxiredoxin family protein [Hufsiella ginkgonis]|uniref:Redoxin domain-containing protein n=1 Tax=Hufsiella ginkgonis TaxID=2695274 RepID=A0A7K1XSH7_9SPHI|nr:TlpA disulfide reductase family protein [Hufsiella ginkgonis]MXV13961.1 redoxin domain-containing protein [Hufsiella ginkgonis]
MNDRIYTLTGRTGFLVAGTLIAVLLSFCTGPAAQMERTTWRAALKTDSGAEIPFNFSVTDSAGEMQLEIMNGTERFRVTDIRSVGDSVFIRMPLFDSDIRALLKGTALEGHWIKHLATKDVMMEFNAVPGDSARFRVAKETAPMNVAGKWAGIFTGKDGKDTSIAVGEFVQNGQKVTGTFLTTTGDYRFLEGAVSGRKLSLSCFDGSHAFLFTGDIGPDNKIGNGKFYSGLSSVDLWTATRDENAALPDAYSLTKLKPGFTKIDFSFPDLSGKKVSLSDERYRGKVVIIQFMGSWCPNCMDETAYLVPFYNKYKERGLEIIGLAYERFTDFKRAKANITQLKDHFGVNYELLATGYQNDKKEVARSVPALKEFLAFPTTILINRKGEVSRIHTGFSGPGTGKHYDEFITEFEKSVNDLLAEKPL